jgi:hypothetical protein
MADAATDSTTSGAARGAPLRPYLHFAWRNACNLSCFYCYESPHPPPARAEPLEPLVERLRLARTLGYVDVALASGELVLYPRWRELVRAARDAGYRDVLLVSNLTRLDERLLDELEDAGVDGIVGSLFALDDAAGHAATRGRDTWQTQTAVLRRVGARPGLRFRPHLLLTKSVAAHPLGALEHAAACLGRPLSGAMISAIEVVGPRVARHPQFATADAVDWPALLGETDRRGVRVVTQNVPACRLGAWVHRDWRFTRRVARLLVGFPEGPAERRLVERQDGFVRGQRGDGACAWTALCHDPDGLPCTADPAAPAPRLEEPVAALLAEHGMAAPPALVARLAQELLAAAAAAAPAEAAAPPRPGAGLAGRR